MVAYTGIETISNMAEEARDYGKTIPRAVGAVVFAVAVIYAFLPAVALSAMPVVNGETALATEFAGDPVLGVVENMDLGALQGAAEVYVGDPRRDDPVHRDERRADRGLAADVLDGAAPPAARRRCASCIRSSARRTWRSSCSARSRA